MSHRILLVRILLMSTGLMPGKSLAQSSDTANPFSVQRRFEDLQNTEISTYEDAVNQSRGIESASKARQIKWARTVLAMFPDKELADQARQIIQRQLEIQRKRLPVIQQLITSQQITWAEEIRRDFPDSDLAKEAERILGDYRSLHELDHARKAIQQQRTAKVVRFWQPQRDAESRINAQAEAARDRQRILITNPGPVSVVYEVRIGRMDWTGPYRLLQYRSDATFDPRAQVFPNQQVFYEPVQIRFIIDGRPTRFNLEPGEYEFRYEEGSRTARGITRISP